MGPTRDLGAVEIGRRENAAAARVPVKGRAPRSAPVKAKRALAGRTLASLIVLFVVPRFGPLAAGAESVTAGFCSDEAARGILTRRGLPPPCGRARRASPCFHAKPQ